MRHGSARALRRGRSPLAAVALAGLGLAQAPADLAATLERRLAHQESRAFAAPFYAGLRELARRHAELNPSARSRYLDVRHGRIAPDTMKLFHQLEPERGVLKAARERLNLPSLEAVVATVADLDAQLRAAGVELLVVPLPDRLMIYPDLIEGVELDVELDGSRPFEGFGPGFVRFQLALLDAGVEVVDLLGPLAAARGRDPAARDAELVFLRDNSHWSPLGAAIGGDVVAARIAHSAWFRERPPAGERARLEHVRTDELSCKTDGADETTGDFELDRVVDSDGEPVAADDDASPVLVLGDSYTTIFALEGADFARRLHYRLGFAPDVIASPGGGALSSRRMLARRAEPLAGKRTVVWMFTVRALLDGPKRWRKLVIDPR